MVLDNANPVILDASQLASNRQKRRRRRNIQDRETVKDNLINKDCYTIDPYYMLGNPDLDSESDDPCIGPIDEQEIYS